MKIIKKIVTSRQPEIIYTTRNFFKKRRSQQFKLIKGAPFDSNILKKQLTQLFQTQQPIYTFAQNAIKHQHLNAIADVNFSRALSRPNTIPFSVKDHLRVKDMIQTCGYSKNIIPSTYSCDVVNILQDEGFTAFMHSNVPQGIWGIQSNNYLFGLSKNPYNTAFTSGGSSGGQCSLVRTRSSAFGLGSDSAGSVRIPASFCGVFSFKPTGSRRLSRTGRIGIGGDQGNLLKDIDPCMGFITRNVNDIKFLASKTLGKRTKKDWLLSNEWKQDIYGDELNKKHKFGYMIETNQVNTAPAIKNAILQTVQKLKKLGHTVIQYDFKQLPQFTDTVFRMFKNPGIYQSIRKRLDQERCIPHNEQYINLKELGNWACKFKRMTEKVQEKKKIYDFLCAGSIEEYFAAIRNKDLLKEKYIQQWNSSEIDYLISPVVPFTALLAGQSKYLINLLTFCCYQNLLEMPAGVIPIRLVKPEQTYYKDDRFYGRQMRQSIQKSAGLPVCIQISSDSNSDQKLIAGMKIIESITEQIPEPIT